MQNLTWSKKKPSAPGLWLNLHDQGPQAFIVFWMPDTEGDWRLAARWGACSKIDEDVNELPGKWLGPLPYHLPWE
jgi:hypothetical protein